MKKWIVAIFGGFCLSCAASTVSIEARFIQVDLTNSPFEALVTNLLAVNHGQPTNAYGRRPYEGILTSPQFEVVQNWLMRATNGANPFVTARVTADSGRQAEVGMTDMATNAKNDVLEFNVRLAVAPIVSTNEFAIELHFIHTTETSLPYYEHPPRTVGSIPITTLSDVLPPAMMTEDAMNCAVWDGQTVVFEQFPDRVFLNDTRRQETLTFSEARKKRLMVFLTVTLVDEHGQRIQSENETPPNTIPPQPASTRQNF